jgi:hypothetical protein
VDDIDEVVETEDVLDLLTTPIYQVPKDEGGPICQPYARLLIRPRGIFPLNVRLNLYNNQHFSFIKDLKRLVHTHTHTYYESYIYYISIS